MIEPGLGLPHRLHQPASFGVEPGLLESELGLAGVQLRLRGVELGRLGRGGLLAHERRGADRARRTVRWRDGPAGHDPATGGATRAWWPAAGTMRPVLVICRATVRGSAWASFMRISHCCSMRNFTVPVSGAGRVSAGGGAGRGQK